MGMAPMMGKVLFQLPGIAVKGFGDVVCVRAAVALLMVLYTAVVLVCRGDAENLRTVVGIAAAKGRLVRPRSMLRVLLLLRE